MNNNSGKKVFLGLSGGVDSAVSAYLLKEQGYEVTGVFMKNWSGDDFGIQADCPWEEDQKDAEAVCKHLGIPFRSVNFEKEYREKVVDYFFSEYKKGRTPNPDVMCNKEIKFKLFLEKAMEEGYDFIATGHYARRLPESGKYVNIRLLKGSDPKKDQTYFLYNLKEGQLRSVLFPIGNFEKSEVRAIAEKIGLPNAKKPDSQGICFIGEINVLKFLMSQIPEKPGDIIDIDTKKIVGQHKGIYFYTIGQREGLRIGGTPEPYFVCKKDIENNVLYVCMGENHEALYSKEVYLENLHLIDENEHSNLNNLTASVRYRHQPQPGNLILEGDIIKFVFDEPQRAVTSGQSLVIYKDEDCLGGGIIK